VPALPNFERTATGLHDPNRGVREQALYRDHDRAPRDGRSRCSPASCWRRARRSRPSTDPPMRGIRVWVACAFNAIGPRSSLAQAREDDSERDERACVLLLRRLAMEGSSTTAQRLRRPSSTRYHGESADSATADARVDARRRRSTAQAWIGSSSDAVTRVTAISPPPIASVRSIWRSASCSRTNVRAT
jgi:hypothetical protein